MVARTELPAASQGTNNVVRRAKLLRPRTGSDVVVRQRLFDRLDGSLECPLVLVIGPAGFGKTTLVSSWLEQCRQPSAWVSLDEDDTDLMTFVSHVVAAMQTAAPGTGIETLELLHRPLTTSGAELGATLCDELISLDDDIILVLDDYHLIDRSEVHEFIAALMRHPAPALHLVISSRHDPPLPIARLRTRGLVAELRAVDLRLTDQEVRAVLSSTTGIDLDAEGVRVLQEEIDGWMAGLRLAALAFGADAGTGNLRQAFEIHGRRHVREFLLDEVLTQHPKPLQEFLERTSIVDRVCPSLAEVLLDSPAGPGAVQTMLEELARGSFFVVPLGEEGAWYRYHHLFRDLLRFRLELAIGSEGVAKLHERASGWYEANGAIEPAIKHALSAGDVVLAARILERNVGAALESGEYHSLGRWLALLPDDVIQSRPGLLVALGWNMVRQNLSEAIQPYLRTAQALIDNGESDLDEGAALDLQGHIAALNINAGMPDLEPDVIEAFARRALELLPVGARVARGYAAFALGHALRASGRSEIAEHELNRFAGLTVPAGSPERAWALVGLATVFALDGKLSASEQYARIVTAFGVEHRDRWAEQWGRLILGLNCYRRNELDDAIEHLRFVAGSRPHAGFAILRDSMIGLGLAYQANGQPEDARSTCDALVDAIAKEENLENVQIVTAFSLQLALSQDDRERAFQALDSLKPVFHNEVVNGIAIPALTRVRILLARNGYDDLDLARREVTVARERFRRRRHRLGEIEALALLAMIHQLMGEQRRAAEYAGLAVVLAEPAGIVRPLVDLGPEMAAILRSYASRAAPTPFLDRLLAAFARSHDHATTQSDGEPSPGQTAVSSRPNQWDLPELLTDREYEVLTFLGQRLSNKEIADELFISPLTVKRHASNIYGKLGVENRREAIRRSRELGLLPTN